MRPFGPNCTSCFDEATVATMEEKEHLLERILRLESEMFKLRSRLNILEARNQHNQPIAADTKSNLDPKWLSQEICKRLGNHFLDCRIGPPMVKELAEGIGE